MNAVSPDAIRAETITITGHGGDEIEAYRATPLAEGSRGAVVWIHHMPGYDRETKEFVRRLAVSGYHAVAPDQRLAQAIAIFEAPVLDDERRTVLRAKGIDPTDDLHRGSGRAS